METHTCGKWQAQIKLVPYRFEGRALPSENVSLVDRPWHAVLLVRHHREVHDGALVHVDGEDVLLQEEVDDGGLVGVHKRDHGDHIPRHLRVVGAVVPDVRQRRLPGVVLPPGVDDRLRQVQRPDDHPRLSLGIVAPASDVHEPHPAGAHTHDAVPVDVRRRLVPVLEPGEDRERHELQLRL